MELMKRLEFVNGHMKLSLIFVSVDKDGGTNAIFKRDDGSYVIGRRVKLEDEKNVYWGSGTYSISNIKKALELFEDKGLM